MPIPDRLLESAETAQCRSRTKHHRGQQFPERWIPMVHGPNGERAGSSLSCVPLFLKRACLRKGKHISTKAVAIGNDLHMDYTAMLKALAGTPSLLIRSARRPDYPHFRDHELVAASFRMAFADRG